MKKEIIVLLSLLCSVCLSAEVLKIENFDYTIGSELTNCGWTTQYGSASGMTVSNGLELAGYAGCGIGGAAVIDVKSSSAQPHLSFTEQTTGDVYVAFMLQPIINLKSGYFFCLRDNQIDATHFNYNARIFLGEDYRLGLTFADNQKVQYAGEALDGNQVYLLVLRYSIVAGAGNDSVSLYVFAEGEARPDSEADAHALLSGIQDSNKEDIAPANVVLRGYDTNGWLVVDGIRVATTWQEAVANTATTDCGQIPSGANHPSVNQRVRRYIEAGQLILEIDHERYTLTGERLR